MIALSRRAVVQGDKGAVEKVMGLEDELIDPLCATLDTHLSQLLQEDVSEEQRWYAFRLKRRISDIERVADVAMDLARAARKKAAPKKVLGKKALEELDQLFKRTHRTYLLALKAVQDGDRDIAQMALRQDEKMRRVYWKSRRRLSKRVEAGKVEEGEDALFLELLRSLERISDHADNLGVSVMRA
jgi:Na+/phosphate symporter